MNWPALDRWRAPEGDFPPRWATAWGDDEHGLWAEITLGQDTQRMRWLERTGAEGFWMGSPQEERDRISNKGDRDHANVTESVPRCVHLPQGFWLADTPCTQAFWAAVMGGDRPSHFKDLDDAHRRPVERVSWDDVMGKQGFLARLSTLCPALAGRAALPTEQQWEYAARAGTREAYPWGDVPDDRHANWNDQHGGTTPVGQFPANAFGLFDMHGNVWEWCADVWSPRPGDAAADAAAGPSRRAVRGGSWVSHPDCARSAFRLGWPPAYRTHSLGFRFALRSSSPVQAR